MITLDRLEQKLDALAESQGKLLAALYDNELDFNASQRFVELFTAVGDLSKRLDAMDAGLHETAMRNHQQVLARLMEIRLDTNLKWSPAKPPRKASKKARRAVGKAR